MEADNKGWDLEVTRGAVKLLVEVKGCSGDSRQVELTPNEYAAMGHRRYREIYRLAVVTRALEEEQRPPVYGSIQRKRRYVARSGWPARACEGIDGSKDRSRRSRIALQDPDRSTASRFDRVA